MKTPHLRSHRLRRYWTQDELAERAHFHTATIIKMERGGSGRITTVRRLAEALGVSPDELVLPVDSEQRQPWRG